MTALFTPLNYFVGLRPPAALAERALAWQRSFGHAITEPHVTLKAPGPLSAAQIAACEEVCKHAAPFPVRIGGVQGFGEQVIYLRAEGSGLSAVHRALVAGVGQAPGKFELDTYHAHLTLAVHWRPIRFQPGQSGEPGGSWADLRASAEAAFADLDRAPLEFTARAVVLYRKDTPGRPYLEDRVWAFGS